MKDFLYAVLLAVAMVFVACKYEDKTKPIPQTENGKRVISINNSDNVNVKVKEGQVSDIESENTKDNSESNISKSPIKTTDELIQDAISSKPTVKYAKAEKEEKKTETKAKLPDHKPAKKPKPNPVKSAPTKYLPKVKFDELTYDFGEITEGDIIKHDFNFTNVGKNKLSIKKATATCGCTKPSFPFIDILPGETGYIGVTYNSVNKNGPQKPEITVFSNAQQGEIKLFLTGTVKPKDKDEEEENVLDTASKSMQIDTIGN